VRIQYLLQHGACAQIQCSGRFRLHMKLLQSFSFINATAIEFAMRMKQAELDFGATEAEVHSLSKCIALLHTTHDKNTLSRRNDMTTGHLMTMHRIFCC
jgi:hypothetical protein